MFIRIKKVGISHKGSDIAIGAVVETDDNSAKSLIESGYAEAVEIEPEKPVKPSGKKPAETHTQKSAEIDPPLNDNPTGGKLVGEGAEDGAGKAADGTDGEENKNVDNPEDAVAKTKKALDAQYKRDELYEAAKAANVEIAFDAKKAEIVDAVVAQGKAEVLLK